MTGSEFLQRRFPSAVACVLACGALAALFFAQRADAQRRPAPIKKKAKVVEIDRVVGLGTRGKIKTPEYDTNIPRGRASARNWLQIVTTYETTEEWTEEIVFSYHVLVEKQEKGKPKYTLFKGSVAYIEVEKGRRHLSTMFLRPNTVKRYGEPVAIGVEVFVKGELADSASEEDPRVKAQLARLGKGNWWEQEINAEIKNGYLLKKNETPFAFINCDDYETIK